MITFKKADASDIERITTLVNSAYRGESSKAGWTTEADLLGGQRTDHGKIQEMIEDPKSQIELALENSELVGCIYVLKEADALYCGMLAVNPYLQNKGVGKLLLTHSEELATSWGYTKVRITVISGRPELVAYYERRGYQGTGKIEPFPEHDPRFGLPKTKLVFQEYVKKLVRN